MVPRPLFQIAKLGMMSTAGNCVCRRAGPPRRRSRLTFSEFSIGCGAMNLPPEVLIRSFLRSVMER